MILTTETWSKEVCDLIDYDNEKLISSKLNIKTSGYIYRKNNEIINSPEKIYKPEDINELLFKIRMSFGKKKYLEIIRNKYDYDENDNIINPNPCFFLLKPSKIDPKMNRYKLNPGEVIKIGRITMRIRDIKFKKNNNKKIEEKKIGNNKEKIKEIDNKKMTRLETTEIKINNNNINEEHTKKAMKKRTQKEIFSKLEKKKKVCRICYIEEDLIDENPLVQPCICTGSLKFIHLKCLRKWVSTRSCVKIDTSSECSIFLIKPVECELCKTKFPDFIKYENRLLPVIDFSQEYDNYLTMESLTLDRQNNKFIYAISLDKDRKIKIGRGHEARVLLSDISVSRVHCIMTVENNQVFIEDNDSKFGTLILVQTPNIIISENLPLYIQVGRTFFECKLVKPFKLFNCCEAEEKNNIFFYYNQNEKFIKDHLGMVIKNDLSDFDSENDSDGNLINNTFEQKFPLDVVNKYKYSSINEKIIFNGERDKTSKMSDNEYLLLKHNKKKKIMKKEMIYDSDEEKKENEENNNNEENINNENNNDNDNNDNDDDDDYDENNEDNITASLNDEDDSDNSNENNKIDEHNNDNNNNEMDDHVNEILINNEENND